jgi:hypothetical protein
MYVCMYVCLITFYSLYILIAVDIIYLYCIIYICGGDYVDHQQANEQEYPED